MKKALVFNPTLKNFKFSTYENYIKKAQTFLEEKGFELKKFSFYKEIINGDVGNYIDDFVEIMLSFKSPIDKYMERNNIKNSFMFTIAKHLEESSKYDAAYFPKEYDSEPFLLIMHNFFILTGLKVFIEE